MDIFCIRGGTPLHGRIALHGAKNAALPLLAATLATGARCELLDCPDISDVTAACAILRHLGCAVEQHGGIVAVDAGSACRSDIPAELMRKMRAAVLFLGPLLARFGTAELSLPGGCVLGARPIDLHLRGLRRMGAEITLDGEHISARTDGLHGCTVALPLPSVGATENLILAALGCRGTLTLCNAAREPEIGDLDRLPARLRRRHPRRGEPAAHPRRRSAHRRVPHGPAGPHGGGDVSGRGCRNARRRDAHECPAGASDGRSGCARARGLHAHAAGGNAPTAVLPSAGGGADPHRAV